MSTKAGTQQDVQDVKAVDEPAFSFVCVGVSGGPFETDCSSYLMKLADKKWSEGITLLEADFPETSPEAKVEMINTWVDQALISHGHLDHIFGLVLASTVQRVQKPVYGFQDTLETINEVFNGRIWPKLASFNAEDPWAFYHLRPYVMQPVLTLRMETTIAYDLGPSLCVKPFTISHGSAILSKEIAGFSSLESDRNQNQDRASSSQHVSTITSTAFLFTHRQKDQDVLFLGDVEPDTVSHRSLNQHVWQAVATRVAQNKLRAVFLECSFPSAQPDHLLFGHLTPRHLYAELRTLAECVCQETGEQNTKNKLRGLRCVIIHVKNMMHPGITKPCRVPRVSRAEDSQKSRPGPFPVDTRSCILQDLQAFEAQEQLGVEFIMAEQGLRIGMLF